MKLDDLIAADNASGDGPIDQDIINALAAHGFVTVSYTLAHSVAYIATITGRRSDGSKVTWKGIGATDKEAEMEAIDALAKWVMAQPIPPKTP